MAWNASAIIHHGSLLIAGISLAENSWSGIFAGSQYITAVPSWTPSAMHGTNFSAYSRPSYWALEPEPSTHAPSSKWSNKDMDPVPPRYRTWSTWNYATYWLSDAANVPVYELASSMLAIGLSWYVSLFERGF